MKLNPKSVYHKYSTQMILYDLNKRFANDHVKNDITFVRKIHPKDIEVLEPQIIITQRPSSAAIHLNST